MVDIGCFIRKYNAILAFSADYCDDVLSSS